MSNDNAPTSAPTGERVAIVGSRNYTRLGEVHDYVSGLPQGTIIVSGGAIGVDEAAERAANACGLETRIFPVNWRPMVNTIQPQA